MSGFHIRFGRKIIKEFRENPALESLQKGHDVTFSEFIKYVLNAKEIEHGKVDRHWTSYTDLCHPCSAGYDFIGKYETFNEDVKNVMKLMNIDSMVSFPNTTHLRNLPPTNSVLNKYFNTITVQDALDICNHFQPDFLMFSYTCQL